MKVSVHGGTDNIQSWFRSWNEPTGAARLCMYRQKCSSMDPNGIIMNCNCKEPLSGSWCIFSIDPSAVSWSMKTLHSILICLLQGESVVWCIFSPSFLPSKCIITHSTYGHTPTLLTHTPTGPGLTQPNRHRQQVNVPHSEGLSAQIKCTSEYEGEKRD